MIMYINVFTILNDELIRSHGLTLKVKQSPLTTTLMRHCHAAGLRTPAGGGRPVP